MTLPPGSGVYRRLAGTLRLAAHSAILETNDERVIRLITTDDLTPYADTAVILEGHLLGPDRLQIEWIGLKPA